ncbi:MAG TPA: methylated-DNA--[protein]-cysteine S-methyltransferase [Xanthobacteraceae bacterium]|nr:methylated-DNA--[protein]-cysteine S-methyltransferase [Xanthobacteraceae bacterium]
MAQHFAIFDTPIGACGIVWNDFGIVGVQLPEATEGRTRSRLLKRFREARETEPSPKIAATIRQIVALLSGECADFSDTKLDVRNLPDFNRRVYGITSTIPAGSVMTYGEIAAQLGEEPQVAREVGKALGENPIPLIIPCHRVLAANGKPGGYSGSGGVKTKLRLLTIEGAKLSDEPCLFDKLPLTARPVR